MLNKSGESLLGLFFPLFSRCTPPPNRDRIPMKSPQRNNNSQHPVPRRVELIEIKICQSQGKFTCMSRDLSARERNAFFYFTDRGFEAKWPLSRE